MQAVVRDDACDAPGTDDPAALAEFLGDDVRRGLGIEEAMPDDLSDDFVGASVVAFGSAFLIEQRRGAVVAVGLSELEIALLAEAELAGRRAGSESVAFAFEEHDEFGSEFVVGRDVQDTVGTDKLPELRIEGKHGSPRVGKGGKRAHPGSRGGPRKSN